MRCLFTERPQAERYKQVVLIRVHWMDAYETHYPWGLKATMLRTKELVDETPNIVYTPTSVLQELLVPNHDQSEGFGESIADNFSGNDTSDEE